MSPLRIKLAVQRHRRPLSAHRRCSSRCAASDRLWLRLSTRPRDRRSTLGRHRRAGSDPERAPWHGDGRAGARRRRIPTGRRAPGAPVGQPSADAGNGVPRPPSGSGCGSSRSCCRGDPARRAGCRSGEGETEVRPTPRGGCGRREVRGRLEAKPACESTAPTRGGGPDPAALARSTAVLDGAEERDEEPGEVTVVMSSGRASSSHPGSRCPRGTRRPRPAAACLGRRHNGQPARVLWGWSGHCRWHPTRRRPPGAVRPAPGVCALVSRRRGWAGQRRAKPHGRRGRPRQLDRDPLAVLAGPGCRRPVPPTRAPAGLPVPRG